MSNIQEVKARGGSVIAITDRGRDELVDEPARPTHDSVIGAARTRSLLTPIVDRRSRCSCSPTTSRVRRGCDVDQPRNLAKSVTVE